MVFEAPNKYYMSGEKKPYMHTLLTFLVSEMGLTTLGRVLRTKLGKLAMKCKNNMSFNFQVFSLRT